MIDVSVDDLNTVKEILKKYVPGYEVQAFGSRVNGQAKKYSDLDLVIVGKQEIPEETFIGLKEALQESRLPFRVDVMDWHSISENFRKIIKKECIIIME